MIERAQTWWRILWVQRVAASSRSSSAWPRIIGASSSKAASVLSGDQRVGKDRHAEHDRGDADEAGGDDEDDAVDQDVRRRAAALLLVEQFEDLPLQAGAADRDRELDDGDGDRIGAEQGGAEQPAGDEHEQQPRAEADQEAQSGGAVRLARSGAARRRRSLCACIRGERRLTKRLCPTNGPSRRSSAPPCSTRPSASSSDQAAALTRWRPLLVGLERKGETVAAILPASAARAALFALRGRGGAIERRLRAAAPQADPRPFRDRRPQGAAAGARARRAADHQPARL